MILKTYAYPTRALAAWGALTVTLALGACQGQLGKLITIEGGTTSGASGDATASDGKSKLSDTIRTGLVTSEELEATPYGFRVTWIEWDSYFRGTELRVGDRVIGLNGKPYLVSERPTGGGIGIGQYGESRYWEQHGGQEGAPVALTVWRKGKIFEVKSKLRADRFYYTPDERAALAPGGPDRIKNDGLGESWLSWYEKRVDFFSRVLDGGLRDRGSTRMRLEDLREEKARVDFAVAHYPGPFADTLARDWQRVHDLLLGPERTITAKDLEYREMGEKRADEVAQLGARAREQFLASRKDELIDAFPAIDPVKGDLRQVAGKLVVLPELGNRDFISEAGHGYLVAGDARKGRYFVDSRSPAMERLLGARYRYTELVTPKIKETYAIIGRITATPTMRVIGNVAVTGLEVEVVAATLGGRMFVDTTVANGRESPFAGQAELYDPGAIALPENATPTQVMEAMILALKTGNQTAFAALFAPWYLSLYGNGRLNFHPHYYASSPNDDWVRARRLILDKVYDVNVLEVGLVVRLTTGKELKGMPVVEQIEVELEHIGKFEEGYRPFVDVNVRRVWQLERLDGGPWRIVTRRGI